MRWKGDKRIPDDPNAKFNVIRVTEAEAAKRIDPNEAAKYLLLPEEVAFFETHFPGVDLRDLSR